GPGARPPRARALRARLSHRLVHACSDVVSGRRRHLAVGLQLRLGHGESLAPRRRARRLRASVARVARHRPACAPPGHGVVFRALQHGRAPRRQPCYPRRVPRGGDGGRRRRLAPPGAHRRAPAPANAREPRHSRLHRQDETVRAGVGDDARRAHVGDGNRRHPRGQARVRVEDPRPRVPAGHRRHRVRDHLRPLAAPHTRAAATRGVGVLSVRRRMARSILLVPVLAYTVFSAGPYVWTAMMSLRTTDEIYRSHYGLPVPAHWDKYARAWIEFGYATYFRNSTIVSVVSVLLVTVIGAMAGFAFRRRRSRFPLRYPLF